MIRFDKKGCCICLQQSFFYGWYSFFASLRRGLQEDLGGDGTGDLGPAAAVFHQDHEGQGVVGVINESGEPGVRLAAAHLGGAGLGADGQVPELALPVLAGHVVPHHGLQALAGRL